jgi:hypothetical protein
MLPPRDGHCNTDSAYIPLAFIAAIFQLFSNKKPTEY